MAVNPNAITLSLDQETLKQVKRLAACWGLLTQRNISAIITRCVERIYTEELTGVKIGALSNLEDDEFELLLSILAQRLYDLRQYAKEAPTTWINEIERTEKLVDKIRSAN